MQADQQHELAVVAETTAAIASAPDLEQALRALIAGMHRLTGADSGGVRLLHEPDCPTGGGRLLFWQGDDTFEWREVEGEGTSNTALAVVSGAGQYTPDLATLAERGDEPAAIAHRGDGVGSSLIAPLRSQGRVIGTLHADAHAMHAFSAALLMPMQVLADHAGGAVEQARLREEASTRLQRLEAAARISAAVNAAGDLDGVLRTVLENVLALVHGQAGTVSLVDNSGRFLRDRLTIGGPARASAIRPLFPAPNRDEDVFSIVSRTGRQEVILDDASLITTNDDFARAGRESASVLTPIRHAGETVGVLSVLKLDVSAVATDDLAMLQLAAEQLAGAVARARSEVRRGEMAEQVAVTLAEVGAAAGVEQALEALLRGAMALLQGDGGVTRLFDRQTGECVLVLSLRTDGTITRDRSRQPLRPGSTAAALLAGGISVVIQDYLAMDPTTYPFFDDMRRQGVRSSVNVGIHAHGERTGSLHINHRQPGYFGSAELSIAEALASQAGAAIERASLVEAEHAQLRARLVAEARYRALLESAPDAVISTDAAQRITLVNERVTQLFGYPPDQLVGQPLRVLLPAYGGPDSGNGSSEEGPPQAETALYAVQEFTARRRDGSEFPVELSLSSWYAEGERFFSAIIRDATARKQAEARLARQYREAEAARGESRAILDSTHEAMVLLAPNGRILSVNRRFGEIFGLHHTQLVGRHIRGALPALERALDLPDLERYLTERLADQETVVSLSLHQYRPQERDLDHYSTPVHTSDGEPLGRLFVLRDVSQERAAERMKNEFVSLVTHELRTPLTSIKGYVDLLMTGEAGKVTAGQREFLAVIARNADREIALVNDLLDLSRLEAERMELVSSPVALAPLIKDVAISFHPLLQAKRQTFVVEAPTGLPPAVGDPARLTQVFTNLIANSHNYTPPGGTITVMAREENGDIRVDVCDTGIGLTEDEQARLFTKFFRAKNRATQEAGGTGLGLTITKSLVERHGGTIAVRSAPGKGTTVTVTLPAYHGG